ncbi:MAG: DUF2283 domain-containing protein [Actinomycetes bacterium]|jgi:uncharacterized protein YuzE
MHIEYDASADATYVYLTDDALTTGRDSIPCDRPEGTHAMVIVDWKDSKILGMEVLDAASLLHADLLAQAERIR